MFENAAQALPANYQGLLSLITFIGIMALTQGFGLLARLKPSVNAAYQVNKDTYKAKMAKPNYAANQNWNRKWALGYLVADLRRHHALLSYRRTATLEPGVARHDCHPDGL